MNLRKDADWIVRESIQAVLPDKAVYQALNEHDFGTNRIYIVAVGKAAWRMAKTAKEVLGRQIYQGIVVTKYQHVEGEIPGIRCYEAGHPIPDENSFKASQEIIDLVSSLGKNDTVLFLLSGGGSSLFEKSLISEKEFEYITCQLLACGADIVEMNTVRKRLSAVKGGKFAQLCSPAQIFSIVLSDILEDSLDMIASGPAYPDSSTSEMALQIVKKYNLHFSSQAMECLRKETPKILTNVETRVTGSVKELCVAAARACEKLGYETMILTEQLSCEAREAGSFLASIAKSHQNAKKRIAYIAGGETVVHLVGNGKGGRNQELVLSAAAGIEGLQETAIFSIGSDGTDGPTDAAGGYCDGNTGKHLRQQGVDIYESLQNNDAYSALEKCDGLIFTGPTGTNVNDVAVVLIRG